MYPKVHLLCIKQNVSVIRVYRKVHLGITKHLLSVMCNKKTTNSSGRLSTSLPSMISTFPSTIRLSVSSSSVCTVKYLSMYKTQQPTHCCVRLLILIYIIINPSAGIRSLSPSSYSYIIKHNNQRIQSRRRSSRCHVQAASRRDSVAFAGSIAGEGEKRGIEK